MFENLDAPELLALIAEQRRALREIVSGRDEAAIARRPLSGKWSALENIRHLLFAEQAHLGRYVPDGRRWSPFGYTPQTMRDARDLSHRAGAPVPSPAEVMAAWDALHASNAGALAAKDSAAARAALARNLKHLRAHVAVVRRLVRES